MDYKLADSYMSAMIVARCLIVEQPYHRYNPVEHRHDHGRRTDARKRFQVDADADAAAVVAFSHALVGDLRLRSLLQAARSASYRRALGQPTGYHSLRSRSSRIDAELFSRASSLDFPPAQSHDDFLVFLVRHWNPEQ
jgi:hypothetical protein